LMLIDRLPATANSIHVRSERELRGLGKEGKDIR
jgi:hypothetical protein